MLSKKERLSRKEFSRFFSLGKRSNSKIFTLVYSPHPTFQASVVVPKKVEKSAVKRNKIRRQIYDIVRSHQKTEDFVGVFIFLLKSNTKELKHEEVIEEVLEIIKKAINK